MCLHISTEKKKNQSSFSEKSPKPLIAKKDIRVYKIFNSVNYDANGKINEAISVYQDFKYKKGKKYILNGKAILRPSRRQSSWNNLWEINRGFHAYRTSIWAKNKLKGSWMYDNSSKIIQFYIPKGSSYYYGTDGEIVSNQIEWR